MRLNELFEVRLPLVKGVTKRARAHYGAFVCVMRPEDFLWLTTDTDSYDYIKRDVEKNYSWEKYLQAPSDQTPFLDIEWDSGKVIGHEGRHRAMMMVQQGGRAFPCIIYPRQRWWIVSWTDQTGEHAEEFPDPILACDREAELKQDKNTLTTLVRKGGHEKLRGHPLRSEDWDYSPWRIEDFPDRLRGQYSSFSMPKSMIKIGLVKGYTHHTRP
jgi:hypothetical protein